ncbi:MAG: hypothetical protein KAT90_14860 [Gammaproteobacteria bacterium]|nr:hypothetical protein [Gammaproteobacteria bacterium]
MTPEYVEKKYLNYTKRLKAIAIAALLINLPVFAVVCSVWSIGAVFKVVGEMFTLLSAFLDNFILFKNYQRQFDRRDAKARMAIILNHAVEMERDREDDSQS